MSYQIYSSQNKYNHGYYNIGKSPVKYDLFYQLGDALELVSIGIGPENCNNCLEYGTLRGVFICPCRNCILHEQSHYGNTFCSCCDDLPQKLVKNKTCDSNHCKSRYYLERIKIDYIGCDIDGFHHHSNYSYNRNKDGTVSTHIHFDEDSDSDSDSDSESDYESILESVDLSCESTKIYTDVPILQLPSDTRYIVPYKGKVKYSPDRKERTVIDIINSTSRSEKCSETIISQKNDEVEVTIEYSKNGKTQYVYDKETDELITKYTVGSPIFSPPPLRLIHPDSFDEGKDCK
jgi:hypothetical protein